MVNKLEATVVVIIVLAAVVLDLEVEQEETLWLVEQREFVVGQITANNRFEATRFQKCWTSPYDG